MQGFWPELLPAINQRSLVMGVLNVTPDSFSDGGLFLDPEEAVQRGLKMLEEGADIIDVGGESTRPGAKLISEEEELARVLPVIGALAKHAPISIDTNKSSVAEAAAEAGASIVNDISGGNFDPAIREVVAKHGLGYVMMHARAKPETMQKGEWHYEGGVVEAVRLALQQAAELAVRAGIPKGHLMVDPGFGFGKTLEENCQLLEHLEDFQTLGFPVLVGTSKKSFLGALTGKTVENRGFATAASVALAAARGAKVVRVRDVAATCDVLRVVDACTSPLICD